MGERDKNPVRRRDDTAAVPRHRLERSRTLADLVPVLIAAPADEPTRAGWLERLRQAILDDGVDCLAPIAVYPAQMILHADRDLDLIRAARDFVVKEPAFAAEVALHATGTCSRAAATRQARSISTRRSPTSWPPAGGSMPRPWAVDQVSRLASRGGSDDLMANRLRLKLSDLQPGLWVDDGSASALVPGGARM